MALPPTSPIASSFAPRVARARVARSRTPFRAARHVGACALLGLSLLGLSLLGVSSQGVAGGLTIIDDLFVGVWSPFGTRWEASSRVCVEGAESFRVIATSVDGDVAFSLDDGAGSEVPYAVFWQQGNGRGRGPRLVPGVASRRVITGDDTPGCGGGNARISVRIDRRAIDLAPPGIYTDTLLLMLSPL